MADENPQGGQDKLEGLQKLLAKKDGDAMAVAALLFSENFDLREKNRKLNEKLPADGAVLLSKDEVTTWEAFKALNVKPEDVKTKIEAHDTVAAENATLKKEKTLREVADAGYALTTLRDFDALEGAGIEEYVVNEETKDGKAVKSVSVKVGGQLKPFEEYAQEKRPALASILKSETSQGGTQFPKQPSGGKAPAKDLFTQIRQEEEEKKKTRKPVSDLDSRFPRATAA